jgi:formylglycine-generating enzyme required for sulfatase activity
VVVTREVVKVARTHVRIGLEPGEADRLARELAEMQASMSTPKFGVAIDVGAIARTRRAWLETAMPAHDVEVGPFEIDVYPVTNADWTAYSKATGALAPSRSGEPHNFVTGVSWREARAFAQHLGLDLPTEAEWEVAARDGRSLFTWGDSYFPQGDIAFASPVLETYRVGSRPEIASERGVRDLLGQFGEYCADLFGPYAGAVTAFGQHFPSWRGQRVVRGGYDLYQDATCVSRRGVPEDERREHLKFRCVRR